ncbi:hypothetical protein R1sor_024732 [Riccia sorocarpa]|uniref:Reverse transcriptase Ty1/copia-type domain-containing protein n=1 Tax=Riccia sorocarpa TaxID=122646 RepID=A0ABD3GVF4_9MARC
MKLNGVWELVDLPSDRAPVDCKWVFRKKTDSAGNIQRYKARLVAKGYTQIRGIDYGETFSPMVHMDSFRLLMAIAAKEDWEIEQLDVDTVFLNGDLSEEIYMRQPPGFEVKGEETKVCRLQKAIYGLKQASRAWFLKFDLCLKELGFHESTGDEKVYVKRTKDSVLVLLLYVDDILVLGDCKKENEAVKQQLKQKFKMKDLGAVETFLAVKVDRDRKKKTVRLSQKKYVEKLLQKFRMEDCKPSQVPMSPGEKLFTDGEQMDYSGSRELRYRELVGSLLYLMASTRPDICYAVISLSQFDNKYTDKHWQLLKRIVSWMSKKQSLTTVSTAEAEYVALFVTTRKLVKFARIVEEVSEKKLQDIPIMVDCQSAMKIASRPNFRSKTVHIPVHYHFVREKIDEKFISLYYLQMDEMTADMFTKALAAEKLVKHRTGLGLVDQV